VTTAAATTAATARDHRLGFSSLDQEVEVEELPVQGAVPPWLTGSLLRTGPARFEVGDRPLAHWFDGLAMLHRFSFAGGSVAYANRFLHSRAYREAQRTGRLAFSEFATDPCRSLFKRLTSALRPSVTDNGNVNVSRLGDEFIAMTETPLPVVFDPHTLEAAGVAYRPPGQLTTAHPHHDPGRAELVNFAVKLGPRSHYRFFAQDGRGHQRSLASVAVREPGYVHSFGMSQRFLVLAEFPLVVNPTRLALSGRPYIENYRWEPERGTRLLVVDRRTGRLRSTLRTDPFFGFHHVNAFDDDGELVVDLCAYEDASIIDALYLDAVREERPRLPVPTLRRFRLRLEAGRVDHEPLAEESFELPRIAYRHCNGRPYRYAYGVGRGPGAWLDQIVKVDVRERIARTWREDGCYPGEPVFVPEAGGGDEDAGVLLSVVLEAASASSFLLVLDACDLGELARAAVPHRIPFGFHGNYFGVEEAQASADGRW
jgi:carotenoid cleavage dioxygenase-like enzyme